MSRVMRAIEAFCACLWDLGIKPGLAVRDPQYAAAIRDPLSLVFAHPVR